MTQINHIGLSSGKDSTALWGWAINESGYPPESIRGSFCDTENEYQEVYDQIEKLDEYGQKRGIAPVVTLHSEGFLNLAIRKKRFPSARARFCTEHLKMIPSRNYILSFVYFMDCEVLAHSGVRGDESTERSLLEEYDFNSYLGVRTRRPLLKWTIDDVWAAHKRYGLPINGLYFTGRKRVGCRLCCMSNKRDVRLAAKLNPEVIAMYADWERILGTTKLKNGEPKATISSFFASTTVPEAYRSIKGLVRRKDSKKGKKGDIYSTATIWDVVEWSKTLRGGKDKGFDFMFEEDDSHVPCQAGYCE